MMKTTSNFTTNEILLKYAEKQAKGETVPPLKIIIPAQTNSEWDSITHIVVDITERLLSCINASMEAIKTFSKADMQSLYNVSFWSYFTPIVNANISAHEITIAEDNYNEDKEERPEQEVTGIYLRIIPNLLSQDQNLSLSWVGNGKHTGEEFWSESVTL